MRTVVLALAFLAAAPVISPASLAAQEKEKSEYALLPRGADTYVGLSVGWVAKEWITPRGGRTLHEDLWGNPDKMLHGFQLGLNVQRDVWRGIGYRTGFNYECYFSNDIVIKNAGLKSFRESNLYFPVHVSFHLTPLKHLSITPYAGVGFNWAMQGVFRTYHDEDDEPGGYNGWTPDFENYPIATGAVLLAGIIYSGVNSANLPPIVCYDYNNHSPHHWNVQAEVGVSVKLYGAELSFTYSWGANKHNIYRDATTHQNKMTATIGFLLGTSNDKNKKK